MAGSCAVVGVGMTKLTSKREDVSIGGLAREAALAALADAELAWPEVDAVVIGKAPDMLEGVMMPELYLAEHLGAVGKPLHRVHTAGSVGGSTGIYASDLIRSGIHDRVLAVTFEKQSDGQAMWALSPIQPFRPTAAAGAVSVFAGFARVYMNRTGAPDHIGILTALKDRRNALKNPYAHVKIPDISYEMIQESKMLADPIRYLESCPSSDGACAVVLASDGAAPAGPRRPAWVVATADRNEPRLFPRRDFANPQAGRDCAAELYRHAGIHDPRREIDVTELYVPFSWYEAMWLENLGFAERGEGWRLVESGATALGGELPVNPSGGVLSSNPIGASGMLRFAEAAQQVRGLAGDHQVDGARTAVGHAYGGQSAYFAMWLVSSEKP